MVRTVNTYLNIRTGSPLTTAPIYNYLSPGDLVEIEEVVIGTSLEGNNIWFQEKATINSLWSGGFESPFEWYIQDFGINELWKYSKGENVTIILIDSGISYCPDLANTAIKKVSMLSDNGEDETGHGTLMASIIAGKGSDIMGTAPQSSIISIKIFSEESSVGGSEASKSNLPNFVKALEYVKKSIDRETTYIVNCSLSVKAGNSEDNDIKRLIEDISTNYKVTFVCAVGNDSGETKDFIPASFTNVISVAGICIRENNTYKRLYESNYWPEITITCLGEFNSSYLKERYASLYRRNGSSHACAYTSGVISILLSYNLKKSKKLKANEVMTFLKTSSFATTNTNKYAYIDNVFSKDLLLKNFLTI